MTYLGMRRMGCLRHRGRVLPPADRPWITDLTMLCPVEGIQPGNLPEFETDPDWDAWTLGDTPSDVSKAIGWHAIDMRKTRLLIADRMLMSRVSWADLDQAGLVFGKEILIDGARYTLRLLTGGTVAQPDPMQGAVGPNEWDILLSGTITGLPKPAASEMTTPLTDAHRTSPHNLFWNWFGSVSWVQDTCAGRSDGRVCRGYHGPQFFYENTVDHRHEDIGWRPVLEITNA